jgi:hypothetical protein
VPSRFRALVERHKIFTPSYAASPAGRDEGLLLMSFPSVEVVSTYAGEVSLQLAATDNQKWAGNERPRYTKPTAD